MAKTAENEGIALKNSDKSHIDINGSENGKNVKSKKKAEAKRTPDLDLQSKYITTIVIYYCNLALGASNYVALALLDFKNIFNTGTQAISLVFTLSIICVLVSATLFGIIFNYVNRHALVTALLFIQSLSIFFVPYFSSIIIFYILNCISSICIGGWLVCQTVWVIEIWKEKANPYIQGQHFFFAIGTVVPPLIFAPFLSSRRNDLKNDVYNSDVGDNSSSIIPYGNFSTNAIHSISKLPDNPSMNDNELDEVEGSQIHIPIAMTAGIVFVAATFQLILLCCLRRNEKQEVKSNNNRSEGDNDDDVNEEDGEETNVRSTSLKYSKNYEEAEKGLNSADKIKEEIKLKPEEIKQENSKALTVFMIILSACFVGSFQAVELSAGQFIPVFSYYSSVNFSEMKGARLLLSYTVAFLVGRLVGIFVSFKITPQFLLCFNLLFGICGNGILLIWGHSQEGFMWAGVILLGLGYSTGVPSIFAYVSNHVEITNIRGSVLMVSGGVISSFYPIILGNFIEKVPVVLMYTNFFSLAIGFFAFCSIYSLTKRIRGKL